MSNERLITIIQDYIANDAETADPGYLRDTILDIMTEEEAEELGLSEYIEE